MWRSLVAMCRPCNALVVRHFLAAARLFEVAPGIKYKAVLGVAYGAGLRVSEVAHLKVADTDSERMLIRVSQGRGARNRNGLLMRHLLELLRRGWREGKRRGVMFPHRWTFVWRSYADPISTWHLHGAVQEAAEAAGTRKRVGRPYVLMSFDHCALV